jgi:hypothetical protein
VAAQVVASRVVLDSTELVRKKTPRGAIQVCDIAMPISTGGLRNSETDLQK